MSALRTKGSKPMPICHSKFIQKCTAHLQKLESLLLIEYIVYKCFAIRGLSLKLIRMPARRSAATKYRNFEISTRREPTPYLSERTNEHHERLHILVFQNTTIRWHSSFRSIVAFCDDRRRIEDRSPQVFFVHLDRRSIL